MAKKLDEYTREELIETINSLKRRKKFGLVWEDKPEDVVEQCRTQLPVLEEVKELTVANSRNSRSNLIIEGDNYHSLSVLNYTHSAKIDLIYIDPPYNTGNKDFIYNDNFVEKEDTFRHSMWLSFMYRRLLLAKSLLASDGSIFISIDDNEYPRLVMMLEEIFGEASVKTVSVKMSEATGVKMSSVIKSGRIPKLKEYLVIVKPSGIKNLYIDKLPKGAWDEEYKTLIVNATEDQVNVVKEIRDNENRTDDDLKRSNEIVAGWQTISLSDYFKSENIPKSKQNDFKFKNAWRIVQVATLTGGGRDIAVAKKMEYDIVPSFFCITTPQSKLYVIKGSFNHETKLPRCKVLFADDYLTIHPGDFWSDIKTTGLDNEGGVAFKNGKKPLKLIERVIKTNQKNDITVLDFFAGSGTTGEAVMRVNEADGGSRRFILCTTGVEKEINGMNIASDITLNRVKRSMGESDSVRYFKTSFVSKAKTDDQTRIELVARSVEMICVREDTFEAIVETSAYRIFSGIERYSAIVFDPDEIPALKAEISKLNNQKPVNIYVFSMSNDTYEADFSDLESPHELRPIPESILEVYRRIFTEQNQSIGA